MVLMAISLVVGLLCFLAILYSAHRKVEMYLLLRGATDIAVQHEFFDFDRNTATFTVHYTGISGNRHVTRCRIRHVFLFLDDSLFWSDPLDMDLHDIEQPDTNWRSGQPTPLRWRKGRDERTGDGAGYTCRDPSADLRMKGVQTERSGRRLTEGARAQVRWAELPSCAAPPTTMPDTATSPQPPGPARAPCPDPHHAKGATFHVSRFTLHAPLPSRLLVVCLSSLLALLTMGAGGPVLQGSQPGDLPLYPEQIAAIQASRQLPLLSAPAALLGDSDTNQVLATLDANQPRAMASTTKIMTALLALERANLADQVVVSLTALVGGSTMGLSAGEVLSVEDLLWGLLLNSGNDAAVALAEHVAGSEAAFVQLMNQRAAELGMRNTRFANPHGLDAPDHYSSAFDLWLVTQEALKQPLFRAIVATPAAVVAGRQLINQNQLLTSYPNADGVKTGTTVAAGESLVGSASLDGHRAVAVILGSQDRYSDARALFEHYSTFWRWAPAPQPAGPASWLWVAGRPLRVAASATPPLFLPAWQWPLVRPQLVTTSVEPGQFSGAIRWYLGNQLLAEAPAILLDN